MYKAAAASKAGGRGSEGGGGVGSGKNGADNDATDTTLTMILSSETWLNAEDTVTLATVLVLSVTKM